MSGQSEVFLEVVTRTFGGRPTLLAANSASLQAQTSSAWTQTFVYDYARRGCPAANRSMAFFAPKGRYVWLLDDDDICIRPTLVAELQEIAQLNAPDVIFMRMDHGPLGVLPGGLQWGNRRLHHGHIGVSAFVVSRDTWMQYREHWAEVYAGDYEFIKAVAAERTVRVYWHDVIASSVQRISRGATEEETAMRFRALQTVRVLIGGQVLELVSGREYEIRSPNAHDLVRAGYVTPIVAPEAAPETAAVEPSSQAVAPKAAKKRVA